jgi:hypothetical protein
MSLSPVSILPTPVPEDIRPKSSPELDHTFSLRDDYGNGNRPLRQHPFEKAGRTATSEKFWASLARRSLLVAETTVQVRNADLSVPFGSVSGRIVTVGDYLVFIDEERPEMSFAAARTDIQNITAQDDTVVIESKSNPLPETGTASIW